MPEANRAPNLLFRWRWLIASQRGPASPTTRHVLLTLGLHMASDGSRAFPSENRLALETGLSERAVSTHLRIAIQLGWIVRKRERQIGKDWAQYFYRAAIPPNLDAPERRSGPIPSRSEARADATERESPIVPNDVPLNATENTANNSTAGSDISASSKTKRHEECAAFLAKIRRQMKGRESEIQDPNAGRTAR
jgi:hypothetical protein